MRFKPIQPRQPKPVEVLQFTNFIHGLNTSKPPDRIAVTEASRLVNWKVLKGGDLENRSPITRYTSNSTTGNAAVKYIEEVNIAGTLYTLCVDANHVLYYVDVNDALQAIGTLEGAARIHSFNGKAVIADGSYLKYLDGVSSIKMLYDGGSGNNRPAVQFDNTAGTDGTGHNLYTGAKVRVAYKFTSQAWTAGYTIPPMTVSVYLQRVNPGAALTGNVTMVLRKASDSSVLATRTLTTAAAVGTTASTKYSGMFASTDITTQMSPSTAYYMSIEYSAAGDASNYIRVGCSTETAGATYTYTGAVWTADATSSPLMSLSPGRPIKGTFFLGVWNSRLWVGGDTDNPGYIWHTNLSPLDCSTTGGGGYISLIDDDSNNFQCGAGIPFYGDLYAFGKQSQPFLVKISGSEPSAYVQGTAFQAPWATHRTLTSSVNDIWYAGNEGVSPLSGVQEYGDLRTFFASDPIYDRIKDYWDTDTAIMGYYPADGQVWVILPSYHRVLVCHVKLAVQGPDGSIRYPWAEYEDYRDVFTDTDTYKWVANSDEYYLQALAGGTPGLSAKPDFVSLDGRVITEGTAGSLNDHEWDYAKDPTDTYYTIYFKDTTGDPDTSGVELRSIFLPQSMAQCSGTFLLGGSDGYLWKVDTSDYKDMSDVQIKPILHSAYIEMPFGEANFFDIQLLASSKAGGRIRTQFYKNSQYASSSADNTIDMSVRDDLLVNELTMDVEDMYFTISPDNAPLYKYVNFNARSVMMVMDDVHIAGYPLHNNGLMMKYRRLSR